jgi:general secretion pathway protein H
MPKSVPGSSGRTAGIARPAGRRPRPRFGAGGFTLLELLAVMVIVAIASALATVALRDSADTVLEREAERLAALLESARAEARVAGATATWRPLPEGTRDGTGDADFRFAGLPFAERFPTRWLDAETRALPSAADEPVLVMLGPDAILPAQRIRLVLGPHRRDVASDGLSPFTAGAAADDGAPSR